MRLQAACLFLSLVGISFGIKDYIHIKQIFGAEDSRVFFNDLILQILIALGVNAIVASILYRIITNPIQNLGVTMRAITDNNLSIEVPYVKQVTEIGDMARQVQIFKDTTLLAQDLMEQERRTAEEAKIRQQKMEHKTFAFNSKVSDLLSSTNEAINSIHASVQEMASAANSTSEASLNTEAAANKTARIVESVTSASAELTTAAQDIVTQVSHAASITAESVSHTKKADLVASNLKESAKKIEAVVDMIRQISGQINLLALNATIEAERAGDAGKGFAVVASEVKNLAVETHNATKTIANHINDVQQVVVQVISTISEVRDGIGKIDEISTSIASAAQLQSTSTRDISHNLKNASAQIQEVFVSTEKASQLSKQTNSTASSVIATVAAAEGKSLALQKEIENFLMDIT